MLARRVRPSHSGKTTLNWITQLSSPDSAARNAAAREIFQCGCKLVRMAIDPWLANDTLAQLFLKDSFGFPEATVGVALEPPTFELVRAASGSPQLAEVPPDQDAVELELEFPGGIRLDVLTSRDPQGSGAIARHLRKFGESIQQVELLTKSVDQVTQVLMSQFQVAPVFPQARPGANGTRVNFFLVPASEGKKVLIELVEARTPAGTLC